MRQVKSVKQSGPFLVQSHSQGRGMVYFSIYPAFPEYDYPDFKWAERRYKRDGGGPSIFTSIAVSRELEKFLNSVYTTAQVKDWQKRIKAILKDESKNEVFLECETCCTVTHLPKECKYCSICGNLYKRSK